MLGILFSVNIGLASCDDRYSEESKEELTPQALYQTSWRGTGSCAAWAVQNMGVGIQFIDTQTGKVNWEGYDEIDIYGVTGGRLDHFFSVMCLLEKYQSVKIRVIDSQNIIELLKPGKHKIMNDGYKYFSLFALKDSYIDIEHAHYPLHNYYLKHDDPLCVSNQTIEDFAYVTNSETIILIRSRDKSDI